MSHSALRSSLQNLSDQSLKTSRHLDDTYYSLLERVATCRQTIGSLQELSNLTNELHHSFETDTAELVEDIGGQVDGLDNFETQQDQVSALERRIKAGKEKAEALNGRLADARNRVDQRMKLETELEVRNTRMELPVKQLVHAILIDGQVMCASSGASSARFWVSSCCRCCSSS
jgi:DNA repair exonuclease SbcCD ATPase subunit